MQIEISLTDDEASALKEFGQKMGAELPDAAKTAIRDWLIGRGYLKRISVHPSLGSAIAGE